jgi:phosphoserine phosphatase RsbU/P
MYTDGLIERRGDDIGDGIRRVAGQLQAWPAGGSAEALCEHLVTSLAGEPQPDDICVLAVRRRDDLPAQGGRTAATGQPGAAD